VRECIAGDTMKIDSVRFGTVEVADDQLLSFVRPIVGFDQFTTYALIDEPETAPIVWFQSLDAPGVLFAAVDVACVTDDFALDLDEESTKALGLERAEDARVMCILTLSPDPTQITVNLRAPIVWNTRRATALQLLLQDAETSISHPVRAAAGACRCNKEVAGAGTDATQG